jgi:hypothetical protein
MSTISAGTSPSTALVNSGDTTGQLVLQTNGTTTAVTIGTNQVVTLAQPLPVASGGTGSTSGLNLASAVTGTLGVANGGTGASSLTANNVLLGNGTSAIQTVAPGSSGNVLTSNGTTWQSTAPAGGGSLILLQTVTASNSATVNLETSIGASYDTYFVTFSDTTAGTDDTELRIRLKFAGTYQESTRCLGYYVGSDGSLVTRLSESQCTITRYRMAVYTSTGKNASGEVYFNRTTNSKYQNARFHTSAWSPDTYGTNVAADSAGSGMWGYTSPVQGIQFYMSSGNIFSGVFRLYGIKNS